MGKRSRDGYSAKWGSEIQVDDRLAEAVLARSNDGKIKCAQAFLVVSEWRVGPLEVGRVADLKELRITHCQLGLFGYGDQKKAVTPAAEIRPDLEGLVRNALEDERLTCAEAWKIAESCHVPKMEVSALCERLQIKIGSCQLGAF
ncbi:MAG: hypothetical protein HY788_01845 [Deltaproteobacteria bacterium]|nr:hypothetical protein [Deltaproteobacteria bacterium]